MQVGVIESKAAWMSSDETIVCLLFVLFCSKVVIALDKADSVDLSLQKPCCDSCIG